MTRTLAIAIVMAFASVPAGAGDQDSSSPAFVKYAIPRVVRDLTPNAVRDAVAITPAQRRNLRFERLRLEEMPPEERARYLIDELIWSHATFAPATHAEGLVEAWSEASIRDPDGVLDPEQRESLLRAIARHARARAQDTPDAFIDLIEREPGAAWRDADELRSNMVVKGIYVAFVEAPIPEDIDARSILQLAWSGLARHGHLFDQAGVGEDGAAFLVRRIGSRSEAWTVGFSGPHALERKQWGSVYFQAGAAFSRQPLVVEDLLAVKESVLFVDAHVLIRMRDGRIANWISMWFYDDDARRWRTNYMQMTMSKVAKVVW